MKNIEKEGKGIKSWLSYLIKFMIAIIVLFVLLTLYLWYQRFVTLKKNEIFFTNEIIPTTEYFDWNVNQRPIFDVKYIVSSKTCPASDRLNKIIWE